MALQLIDAHCHLDCEAFRDRVPEILAGAAEAGVTGLVSCATQPDEWASTAALAKAHPSVAFALGIHPWYVTPESATAALRLADARLMGASAIGEIGLDTHADAPMDLQQATFEVQLAMAGKADLPVVVHCRGAFGELMRILRSVGPPARGGVVHAYSGSEEIAADLMEMGFYLSMGRSLTYRNSKKRVQVLKRIYPGRLLLETDSPDMPPVELSGTVNVPANLPYCLRAAAELLERPEEEIAKATTANARRLFGLPGKRRG